MLKLKGLIVFSACCGALGLLPAGATTFHLVNTATSGISPSGDIMQLNNTGASGFFPTLPLSSTPPAYWYSDPAANCTYPAGTYQFTLWTSQPSGPSTVTVQLALVNSDGSGAVVLGTQNLDVNATGTGAHNSNFTFTGIAAQNLVNQRFRLAISLLGGAQATMVYNGGMDFDTNLAAPYSSNCDFLTPSPTPSPTPTPFPATILKSESAASLFKGDTVTYSITVSNNSLPSTCTDNFDADTPGMAPQGWSGPFGGIGYECQPGTANGVVSLGPPHQNALSTAATLQGYASCFDTFNCPGQVVDGEICAQVDVEAGSSELLWRQNGSNTYQASLCPGNQDPLGTPEDCEVRVVTNGSATVLGKAQIGAANNAWYNLCMAVNGFQIAMLVNGVTVISATDPNQTFPSGSVGVQSSINTNDSQGVSTATTLYDSVTVINAAADFLNTDISDTLPAGLTYLSCSGASCADSGGVVNWNTGKVSAGTSMSMTLTAITNACPLSPANQASWNLGLPFSKVDSTAVTLDVSCQTLTPTPTWTLTASPTVTPSATPAITSTPTNTSTPLPTLTDTPTPVGLHVWPNPFNPQYAVGGVLKAYQVPPGGTLSLYTVSGELVVELTEMNGLITWDGRNQNGVRVSSGIYFYAIQAGRSVLMTGKILVQNSP